MNRKTILTGGAVVGAAVLIKLAAKTAFVAAIFGGTFGGVNYVKTEYQLSIDNIKREIEHTNTQKSGTMIHDGIRYDYAFVEESNKRIVYNYTVTDITSKQLNDIPSKVLSDARDEDKSYSVRYLKNEAMFKPLFEHNWQIQYRQKTVDGSIIEDYIITKEDVLQ